jgi:hypothetical protein
VNHKRVLRILREDNLLAVQPRAFVVTTDSDHEFEVCQLNPAQPNERPSYPDRFRARVVS